MKRYVIFGILLVLSICSFAQQKDDFVKRYEKLQKDSRFVGTVSEIEYCDTSFISKFVELKKDMDRCQHYDDPYSKVLFLVSFGFDNYKQFLKEKLIQDSIKTVRDSLKAVYLKRDYELEFNRLKTDSQLKLDDRIPPSVLFFDTAYYSSFKELLDAMDLIERYDDVYRELSSLFYQLKPYKTQLDLLVVYNTNAENYRKKVEIEKAKQEQERKKREQIQKQKDLAWKKEFEEKNARFSNKISIGESKSSVINKWGMPDKSYKSTYEFGVIEKFEYNWISTWVTFCNGYVQQIFEY